MTGLKQAIAAAATTGLMAQLWRPLVRNKVVVLMLHRFADPDRGVAGHSPEQLRADLRFLRRQGVRFTGVRDLAEGRGPETHGELTVAFTVDDGYAEFVDVAAPVFAEFDCPVTVFVVTGVTDGEDWFWWDRVEYAISQSARSDVALELGGRPGRWHWDSSAERRASNHEIVEALKLMPDDARLAAIRSLAKQLEVDVPRLPVAAFAPMTWDQIRRCAAGGGVAFGPHSVTHPMFPRIDEARAIREIEESWRRLSTQIADAVPVFCYPDGALNDARDPRLLAASGLTAAFTTRPGYTDGAAFSSPDIMTRFRIPRFAYTGSGNQLAQIVSGFERLKMKMSGYYRRRLKSSW